MSHFTFCSEFESGRSVEFGPTYVHPLGVSDLLALQQDNATAIQMQLVANDPLVDGEKQIGRATIKTSMIFGEPPTIFSLVKGGWLPLPFAMPPRFLVDRNVVISLRKLRLGQTVLNGQALVWWTKFFEEGSALFNPLPYAFEAGFRRKPTMDEFIAAYDEGVMELHASLPKCRIIDFEQFHYRAAYMQLEAFDHRNERESKFLLCVCALIAERIPTHKEQDVLRTIISVADQSNIARSSLIVLAVLSCLFEDVHGKQPSIGRQIIKPKKIYTMANAYNAVSDLRHIELAAAGQIFFQEDAFSLCTCDRAIALFWSALSIRGESQVTDVIHFTFDLTTELFPRLGTAELLQLEAQLAA